MSTETEVRGGAAAPHRRRRVRPVRQPELPSRRPPLAVGSGVLPAARPALQVLPVVRERPVRRLRQRKVLEHPAPRSGAGGVRRRRLPPGGAAALLYRRHALHAGRTGAVPAPLGPRRPSLRRILLVRTRPELKFLTNKLLCGQWVGSILP